MDKSKLSPRGGSVVLRQLIPTQKRVHNVKKQKRKRKKDQWHSERLPSNSKK